MLAYRKISITPLAKIGSEEKNKTDTAIIIQQISLTPP
jgi:hypothetical protein